MDFPTSLVAYQCPVCGQLNANVDVISLCIQNHQILEEKEKERLIKAEQRQKEVNQFRFSLTSIGDFSRLLEQHLLERFNMSGKVWLTDIRISNEIAATHCCPVGGIRYRYNVDNDENKKARYPGITCRINGNFTTQEFNKAKVKDSVFSPSIHDLLNKEFVGLHLSSGNWGCQFRGDLTLFFADFPGLQKEYETLTALNNKAKERMNHQNKLFTEYRDYFEAKKMADVKYQVLLMEQRELNEKLAHINKEVAARTEELDNERKDRTTIPVDHEFQKEYEWLTALYNQRMIQ